MSAFPPGWSRCSHGAKVCACRGEQSAPGNRSQLHRHTHHLLRRESAKASKRTTATTVNAPTAATAENSTATTKTIHSIGPVGIQLLPVYQTRAPTPTSTNSSITRSTTVVVTSRNSGRTHNRIRSSTSLPCQLLRWRRLVARRICLRFLRSRCCLCRRLSDSVRSARALCSSVNASPNGHQPIRTPPA